MFTIRIARYAHTSLYYTNLRKRRKPNTVLSHVELCVHVLEEHIADDPVLELVRGHNSTDTVLRSSGNGAEVEQARGNGE